MYAAEAFCRVGDLTQAAQLLEPRLLLIPPAMATIYVGDKFGSIGSNEYVKSSDSQSVGKWITDSIVLDICSSSVCTKIGNPDYCTVKVYEAVVLTNRAVILSIQGDLIEAQNILQRVVAAFPSFAPAVRSLVYVLLRRRDHSEAVRVLQQCCTQI